MRGIVFGLILVLGLTLSILSLRPGGLRRQLRMAARRLRIVLVLGGIYFVGSLIIRLVFPNGPASDYGPPALATVLAVIFVYAGRDPVMPPDTSQPAR
ncbi:MAG: hypothetical protein E6J53_08420 [Chloroflexi bacterium]|nr:MAG: hypothetical protein E6J53_08420 [Chloroflexota bacterium]